MALLRCLQEGASVGLLTLDYHKAFFFLSVPLHMNGNIRSSYPTVHNHHPQPQVPRCHMGHSYLGGTTENERQINMR